MIVNTKMMAARLTKSLQYRVHPNNDRPTQRPPQKFNSHIAADENPPESTKEPPMTVFLR